MKDKSSEMLPEINVSKEIIQVWAAYWAEYIDKQILDACFASSSLYLNK